MKWNIRDNGKAAGVSNEVFPYAKNFTRPDRFLYGLSYKTSYNVSELVSERLKSDFPRSHGPQEKNIHWRPFLLSIAHSDYDTGQAMFLIVKVR